MTPTSVDAELIAPPASDTGRDGIVLRALNGFAEGLVVLALIIVLNGTARPVQTSFLGREGELRPPTPRFYPPGDLGARGATAIAWLLALLGLGWALLAGS